MYKVITLMKRRQGITVDAFQTYWRERHGPLAASLPNLRRYVQSHALPQGYRKKELLYDGISEMWFDDRSAYLAARQAPEGRRIDQDLTAFTDPAPHVVMPVEVKVIVDGPIPAGGVKNIEFVNRLPTMDLAAFRTYWEDRHGPLASGISLMRRYEQNHLALDQYQAGQQPRFDGLAITWFDSTADMKQGTTTEVYARTRADEGNFLKLGSDGHLPFIVTREYVLRD